MPKIYSSSWTTPDERKQVNEFRAKDVVEQLRLIASGMESSAQQYEGCTWLGTFPPGYFDTMHAAILRSAANEIERLRAQ